MGPQSGKSVVALGLMELLSARTDRVGFFRPVVASGPEDDPQIELMRARYALDAAPEAMSALTDDEAQAAVARGDADEVKKRVVAAYRQLEAGCDVVVCEGHRLRRAVARAGLRAERRSGQRAGLPGAGRGRADARTARRWRRARVARESLRQKGCELFGVVVNRVPGRARGRGHRQPRRRRWRAAGLRAARAPRAGLRDGRGGGRCARRAPDLRAGRDAQRVMGGSGAAPAGSGPGAAPARRAGGAHRRHERRPLHRGPRGGHARDRAGRPSRRARGEHHLHALLRASRASPRSWSPAGIRSTRPCGGCSRWRPSRCSRSTCPPSRPRRSWSPSAPPSGRTTSARSPPRSGSSRPASTPTSSRSSWPSSGPRA